MMTIRETVKINGIFYVAGHEPKPALYKKSWFQVAAAALVAATVVGVAAQQWDASIEREFRSTEAAALQNFQKRGCVQPGRAENIVDGVTGVSASAMLSKDRKQVTLSSWDPRHPSENRTRELALRDVCPVGVK